MKHLRLSILLLFAAAFSLLTPGCKENVLINSKVSPADSLINLKDTSLNVITHTYYDDTVRTSLNISGVAMYQAIGAVTDPFFGERNCASYFNIVPVNPSSHIYDTATLDSAFLIMPWGYYTFGDTANTALTQTYQVFYMQDTLGLATNYFTYNSKPIDPLPLSNPTTVNIYHLADSLKLGSSTIAPGMMIKLNLSALKGKITTALAAVDGSSTPNEVFTQTFKGICVKVADSRKSTTSLPYFRLDGSTINASAQVAVFYHTNSRPDSALIEHYWHNPVYCAHFNSVTASYARYPLNSLIHSTQANDSIIAFQNGPGASVDVLITGIKSLPKDVIINKASIQIPMLNATYNPANLQAVHRLYPTAIANGTYPAGYTAGQAYTLADLYPLASTSTFAIVDGTSYVLNTNGTDVTTYTVGLPREVINSIAAGNDTLHIRLTGPSAYSAGNHLVAGGGNHPNPLYRAKLKVVYSTLK